MSVHEGASRRDLAFGAGVVAIKLAAMLVAWRAGFSHVSDDDYSRTVIAQSFAHAPKLDPSGTSWLPLPFWVTGASMMAFGRSLGVARATSWTLGALASAVPYFAARYMQYARSSAWLGAALVAVTPWSVWLASTTVPEGWTSALVASGVLMCGARSPRGLAVASVLLLVGSLSRYEAWPACAFAAGCVALRLRRSAWAERSWLALALGCALAGPMLWMAWNARAHGDAFHFLARVSSFRRAHAGAERDLFTRSLVYPIALATQFTEALALGAVGLILRRRDARIPLLGAACVLAFLIAGELADGAPTHHPERALVPVAIVLVMSGVHAAESRARGAHAKLAAAVAALFFFGALARFPHPPGTGADDRATQIARGLALAGTSGDYDVVPCEYEHFALIAAAGAPERFVVAPLTHSPVTESCPRVTAR